MHKQRLLITGAYGLVGSNICKYLEKNCPHIEVTKVKFDARTERLEGCPYDYIIHAAGYGQPQMFGKEKLKTIEINTEHVEHLFRYLKPSGRFLFISTSEVYSGAKPPYKETDIGTTTPQHPRACYIEGKRCGEAICMAYKELGYDVKIARLALAYGPGTKKGDTRVINQFIEQALTARKIQMRDLGKAKRTYIYIDDAVRLLLQILFAGTDVVYNVGGFSRTTIKKLAEMIGQMTGTEVVPGYDEDESAPKYVDLDMTKTVKEFGGNFTPLENGLQKTIEYQATLYG